MITENRIIEVENPCTKIIPCICVQCPFDSSVKGNFEAVGTLSPEEAAQAKAFGQQFMEIVNAAQMAPELAVAS